MTRRLRTILLLSTLLLAASAIAGVAQPGRGTAADTPAKKTITVTGSGSVTAVPDRAAFDFTVESRAASAKAALAKNADEAAAMIAALKNAGVAAADLQTGQVSFVRVPGGVNAAEHHRHGGCRAGHQRAGNDQFQQCHAAAD